MEISEQEIEQLAENHSTQFFASQIIELQKQLQETLDLASDPEMAELAKGEIKNIELQLNTYISQALDILKKEEEAGKENPRELILEIRAGAGGDEASLFAKEIAEMYER